MYKRQVFQATESQQQVTLQTSTGKHIALTKVPLKEELHAISTSLDKADSAELTYHDVPVNTQIAVSYTHLMRRSGTLKRVYELICKLK